MKRSAQNPIFEAADYASEEWKPVPELNVLGGFGAVLKPHAKQSRVYIGESHRTHALTAHHHPFYFGPQESE